MKTLKILSLMLLLVVATTACNNKKGGNKAEGPVGEWHLISWNEEAPEFDVYISFGADKSFTIYQQVWSLDFECFEGSYSIDGDVISGKYADGSKWACDYNFAVAEKNLTLKSKESQPVTSVYEKCTIPAEIISEATSTRSSEVVPFL